MNNKSMTEVISKEQRIEQFKSRYESLKLSYGFFYELMITNSRYIEFKQRHSKLVFYDTIYKKYLDLINGMKFGDIDWQRLSERLVSIPQIKKNNSIYLLYQKNNQNSRYFN